MESLKKKIKSINGKEVLIEVFLEYESERKLNGKRWHMIRTTDVKLDRKIAEEKILVGENLELKVVEIEYRLRYYSTYEKSEEEKVLNKLGFK